MDRVYDATVIRQRLNSPMMRRVVYSLLVKRADVERWKQERGKEETIMLLLSRKMMLDAIKVERWWHLAEDDKLSIDMIQFDGN